MVLYRRLTLAERYQIEGYLKSGLGVREMADLLDRSPSSISREIKRNKKINLNYQAIEADTETIERSKKKNLHKRKIIGTLKNYIDSKLRYEWSPEQISGRIKKEFSLNEMDHVSYSTIYRYIYECANIKSNNISRFGWRHLRFRRKQRKSRENTLENKPKHGGLRINNRVMIDQRPLEIKDRKLIGDYERDTMRGNKSNPVILTIVDRTSRLLKMKYLETKSSLLAHKATVELLKNETVRTITNDNGLEFNKHEKTSKKLNIKIYFSYPHASWERGSIENINGLIRQYFPKRRDFTKLTDKEIKEIEVKLNNRPRKCLDYKTPLEVHLEQTSLMLH